MYIIKANAPLNTEAHAIAKSQRASGKVKLNYRQIEKADQTVMIGDMISVRGYGRFRLAQQDGFSKSGKAKIVIESLLRRRKK